MPEDSNATGRTTDRAHRIRGRSLRARTGKDFWPILDICCRPVEMARGDGALAPGWIGRRQSGAQTLSPPGQDTATSSRFSHGSEVMSSLLRCGAAAVQENCEVLMWQEKQQALSERAIAGNRGFWHFCGRYSESSESAGSEQVLRPGGGVCHGDAVPVPCGGAQPEDHPARRSRTGHCQVRVWRRLSGRMPVFLPCVSALLPWVGRQSWVHWGWALGRRLHGAT